ncbi:hypothetical protein JCM10213_002509 [Rhodosporidiobolus nylandii]
MPSRKSKTEFYLDIPVHSTRSTADVPRSTHPSAVEQTNPRRSGRVAQATKKQQVEQQQSPELGNDGDDGEAGQDNGSGSDEEDEPVVSQQRRTRSAKGKQRVAETAAGAPSMEQVDELQQDEDVGGEQTDSDDGARSAPSVSPQRTPQAKKTYDRAGRSAAAKGKGKEKAAPPPQDENEDEVDELDSSDHEGDEQDNQPPPAAQKAPRTSSRKKRAAQTDAAAGSSPSSGSQASRPRSPSFVPGASRSPSPAGSASSSRASAGPATDKDGHGAFSGLPSQRVRPEFWEGEDLDPSWPPKLFMRPDATEEAWEPERIWLHSGAGWAKGERAKWAGRIRREGGKLLKNPGFAVLAILPAPDTPDYADLYHLAVDQDAIPLSHTFLPSVWAKTRELGRPYRFDSTAQAHFRAPLPFEEQEEARRRRLYLFADELESFAELWLRWQDPQEREFSTQQMFFEMQRRHFDKTKRTTITGFKQLFKIYEEDIQKAARRLRRDGMQPSQKRSQREMRGTSPAFMEEFFPAAEERGTPRKKRRRDEAEDERDGRDAEEMPTASGAARKKKRKPLFSTRPSPSGFSSDGGFASSSHAFPGQSTSASRARSPSYRPPSPSPPPPSDNDLVVSQRALASRFGVPFSSVERITLTCSLDLAAAEAVLDILTGEFTNALHADDMALANKLRDEMRGFLWSKEQDEALLFADVQGGQDERRRRVVEEFGRTDEECALREVLCEVYGWDMLDGERWWATPGDINKLRKKAGRAA